MNAHDSSIYTHMQAAVDIVGDSAHPTSKVAATITGEDENGAWAISKTNQWPKTIAETIGTDTKIGNSSSTIHAETACIFAANANGHATKNASLFVTDPPCPNCMKNLAEAGITKLYIDHKGFDKDWARRRGGDFEVMSMRIAAKAGIDVHVIYRPKKDQEQKFEVISQHAPDYKPKIENPAIIHHCEKKKPTQQSTSDLKEFWIASRSLAMMQYKDEPFALALATDQNGETVSILVDRHPTIGYTYETVESKQDKYSFILQPLNRLLMIAAKEGLSLSPNHIFSSRTPTARELVNFVGAKFDTLNIGDKEKARDEHGLNALEQLIKSKILTIK